MRSARFEANDAQRGRDELNLLQIEDKRSSLGTSPNQGRLLLATLIPSLG